MTVRKTPSPSAPPLSHYNLRHRRGEEFDDPNESLTSDDCSEQECSTSTIPPYPEECDYFQPPPPAAGWREEIYANHSNVTRRFVEHLKAMGSSSVVEWLCAHPIVFLMAFVMMGAMVVYVSEPSEGYIDHSIDMTMLMKETKAYSEAVKRTNLEHHQQTIVRAALRPLFRSDHRPTQPACILLFGGERQTLEVARQIGHAILLTTKEKRHYETPEIIASTLASGDDATAEIISRMSSIGPTSPVAIMPSIDRLPTTANMQLHALCDNENAERRRFVLIMTASDGGQKLADDCDTRVEAHLRTAWIAQQLNEDKIQPLLTRVGNHNICL